MGRAVAAPQFGNGQYLHSGEETMFAVAYPGFVGADGTGIVCVYSLTGTGSSPTLRFSLVDPAGAGKAFGSSIAMDDNSLVVGDPLAEETWGDAAGRVTLFKIPQFTSSGTEVMPITSDTERRHHPGSMLGTSVGIAGCHLIAGAANIGPSGNSDVGGLGGVTYYTRTPCDFTNAGVWEVTEYLGVTGSYCDPDSGICSCAATQPRTSARHAFRESSTHS